MIKDLIVTKEHKRKKKEKSKKEKKELKKVKITEEVMVHKWGGAIKNLAKGDKIISKSGTKRVVLSAKGDVVRVKIIKIDGVETEEAMSREKIMILGQNIEEIIQEDKKKKSKKEKKEKKKKADKKKKSKK